MTVGMPPPGTVTRPPDAKSLKHRDIVVTPDEADPKIRPRLTATSNHLTSRRGRKWLAKEGFGVSATPHQQAPPPMMGYRHVEVDQQQQAITEQSIPEHAATGDNVVRLRPRRQVDHSAPQRAIAFKVDDMVRFTQRVATPDQGVVP